MARGGLSSQIHDLSKRRRYSVSHAEMTSRTVFAVAFSALLLVSCQHAPGSGEQQRSDAAEQFFRGVYGGNPSAVAEFAAEDIRVSYPIFQEVLGRPVIRGRAAVQAFAKRFAQRWSEPQIQIHEVIADSNRVVLVWSFQARASSSENAPGPVRSWGGISLFEFNERGEIVTELGEESEPGPRGRLDP